MAGYRFCRSDDLPQLVSAYEGCYRVHFRELPRLTVERFKRWIHDYGVWASSCMLAHSDHGDPVGVLIGGKRETENCIFALGVHPDHLRAGHAEHMLTSLARKLAILGPRRIVAEVPQSEREARACFDALGYVAEREYTDFVLTADDASQQQGHPLVGPFDVSGADAAGLLAARKVSCWNRGRESLLKRSASISGLAVASDTRIEACLLYSLSDDGERGCIEFVHLADAAHASPLLGLLVGHLLASGPGTLSLSRAADEEIPFSVLHGIGFRALGRTVGYHLEALPG
jgi:ribosomal protein S18 acetylase RimI-like enzyme